MSGASVLNPRKLSHANDKPVGSLRQVHAAKMRERNAWLIKLRAQTKQWWKQRKELW